MLNSTGEQGSKRDEKHAHEEMVCVSIYNTVSKLRWEGKLYNLRSGHYFLYYLYQNGANSVVVFKKSNLNLELYWKHGK